MKGKRVLKSLRLLRALRVNAILYNKESYRTSPALSSPLRLLFVNQEDQAALMARLATVDQYLT